MKDLSKLEAIIGCTFKNIKLLEQSLVHRSYLNEHPDFPLKHNERMEFLGDAVLELAVTRYLFQKFPNKSEGELTNWRASLVKSETLADTAESIDLNDFLYLSRGEAKDTNSKARRYILANALEALIGAIYLDQGFEAAEKFIGSFLLTKLDDILQNHLYLDPKSRFQEKSQEIAGITPHYKVLSESGPDHAKRFNIGVFLGDDEIAVGEGASKQEAEESAAQRALKAKDWNGT
ncbi:MAG: ribonuclease III [Patescibacteria group bacterium]|nr:ribonuclease III [Patescibacteria group bacterium]